MIEKFMSPATPFSSIAFPSSFYLPDGSRRMLRMKRRPVKHGIMVREN
jgi:hypothetical protein